MMAELPFMATENIMMDAVKAGGDRQELHERIRELSMEAGRTVKVEGKDNDLLERIAADPAFNLTIDELRKSMEPSRYVGRAKEQTVTFIEKTVQPGSGCTQRHVGYDSRDKRMIDQIKHEEEKCYDQSSSWSKLGR